jgi:hypothetical protein
MGPACLLATLPVHKAAFCEARIPAILRESEARPWHGVMRPAASSPGALTQHRPPAVSCGSYMAACGPSGYADASASLRALVKEMVLPLLLLCVAAHARRDGAPPLRAGLQHRVTGRELAMPAACPSSLFGAWLDAYSLGIAAQAAR